MKLKLHFFKAMCIIFFVLSVLPSARLVAEVSVNKIARYEGIRINDFMNNWLVLGPFPVADSFEKRVSMDYQKEVFESEILKKHVFSSIGPGVKQSVRSEEFQWKHVHVPGNSIDFESVYSAMDHSYAYAWAEVDVKESAQVLLGLGSDDGIKVWLNGKLVHQNWIGRGLVEDDDLVSLNLKKGKNQILLKIQNLTGGWGFSSRILGLKIVSERFVTEAGFDDIDALKLLKLHGAGINHKSILGLTSVQSAKIYGQNENANWLIKNGADTTLEFPKKKELAEKLSLRGIGEKSPGYAVLLSQNGEIVYKKGVGYSDIKNKIAINENSTFRIGSITKQFTAAAILKLQEKGFLNIHDSISRFIPDYPQGGTITLQHLLNHTAGIPSYTNKPDFINTVTQEKRPVEMVDSFKFDPLRFRPGDGWDYSNSGYFLLGYIIERVTGVSYAEYLTTEFFTPLGMRNSGVYNRNVTLKNEAFGYSYINGEFEKSVNWDMSQAGAAGAVYSTVEDLFVWSEALFGGKVINEESLVSAFRPTKLNNGNLALPNYGFGWFLGEFRGSREIMHGGSLEGFSSYLTHIPDKNITAIVLANYSAHENYNPADDAYTLMAVYFWDQFAQK